MQIFLEILRLSSDERQVVASELPVLGIGDADGSRDDISYLAAIEVTSASLTFDPVFNVAKIIHEIFGSKLLHKRGKNGNPLLLGEIFILDGEICIGMINDMDMHAM